MGQHEVPEDLAVVGGKKMDEFVDDDAFIFGRVMVGAPGDGIAGIVAFGQRGGKTLLGASAGMAASSILTAVNRSAMIAQLAH